MSDCFGQTEPLFCRNHRTEPVQSKMCTKEVGMEVAYSSAFGVPEGSQQSHSSCNSKVKTWTISEFSVKEKNQTQQTRKS